MRLLRLRRLVCRLIGHDIVETSDRDPYSEWEFCMRCDYDSRN